MRSRRLGAGQNVNATKMPVRMDRNLALKGTFDLRKFKGFDHSYAVSLDNPQDATIDQAYVLASCSMDHHLA